MTTSTRRGRLTLRAQVVKTIRPDTVFIPYHWAGDLSVNLLTNRALDPVSKIPEYKVSACRVASATPEEIARGERAEADAYRQEPKQIELGMADRRKEASR
ncbi:Assimilatory nitrate reductase catalytic subunit [compost metagenome]